MPKKKLKKIYFTRDFSAENVDRLIDQGWLVRAVVIGDSSIELADEYGGEVPAHYKAYLKSKEAPKEDKIKGVSIEVHEKLQKDFDELAKQNADLLSENSRLKEYTSTQEAEIKGRDGIITALEDKLKPAQSEDDKPAKTK